MKLAALGLRALPKEGALAPLPASAFIAGTDEEKSGLVVLRVAEVCNFQEKLLRSLAACANPSTQDAKDQFGNPYCGGEAYSVNPVQIVFGTGVMLRNANLDGNLKLMIYTEVPEPQRRAAVSQGVKIMNTNELKTEALQEMIRRRIRCKGLDANVVAAECKYVGIVNIQIQEI